MATQAQVMKGTPFGFFVQFHLTERCNLACRHCYQAGGVAEMDFGEICGAIADAKTAIEGWAKDYEMEVSPSLHFTGGEPLLREDLFSILRYARACGFSVSLMSNGTIVDRRIAGQLRAAGVSDVQVSLDGLQSIHDSLRGNGAFQNAVGGITSLVAEGVDTNINLTVSRLNMHEVGDLVALAERLGVGGIAFSRLVPSGRGKQLAGQSLTPDEVAVFYHSLRQYKDRAGVVVTSRDPLSGIGNMGEDVPQTDLPIAGCAAGMFGVTITSDGTVMPCRRMDLPIGNVKTHSLRDLWADSPVLWRLRTRGEYHGGCGECRYWPVCRGCRAIALAASRVSGSDDYLRRDPQCPYLRLP